MNQIIIASFDDIFTIPRQICNQILPRYPILQIAPFAMTQNARATGTEVKSLPYSMREKAWMIVINAKPRPMRGSTLAQRFSGHAVSTLDGAAHKAGEICARMFAGEEQAAGQFR